LLVKTSWLLDPLASANERLNDRITMIWTIAGILILGGTVRFAWVFLNGFDVIASEGFYEAAAFATKGELAEAYGPGTGLTAHLSPGMPLLVGTIYRWLGVGTPVAEFTLSCLSLAFVYISFLALDAAFRRLGVAPIARIAAIAVLALIPLNIFFEMRGFRHWEGSLAAAAIALFLVRALTLDARDGRPSWLDLGLLAAGGGLVSLFSLPAALACYGMLGWLGLRRRGWIGLAGTAAASLALFCLISYPWALRNEAVFGEKVWTRTSFGMSLALGFHDTTIGPSDPRKVFYDRADEVLPFLHPEVIAKMKTAGGELGYDRLWRARTEEWIRQHQVGALEIAARHVWEFYFPPRWMWYPDSDREAAVKQALMWAIAFMGFVGLGARLAGRDWHYFYVAAPLFLLMPPYALTEPFLRYRYPISGLLVFLAADVAWRALGFALKQPSSQALSRASFLTESHRGGL
jgi:hypothetical protein